MRSPAARSGSSRRLTLLLLCVILPPTLALVWLSIRLLEQDRELLTQRATERREAMADAVARSLVVSVQGSEQWLRGGQLPRGAARLVVSSAGVTLEPLTHALWVPGGTSLPEAASERFARSEALEFQRRGDRGLSTYAALSCSDDVRVRAGALLRAARVHRSLGDSVRTLEAY